MNIKEMLLFQHTSAWINILYISGRITGATCGIWMSVTSRQNSVEIMIIFCSRLIDHFLQYYYSISEDENKQQRKLFLCDQKWHWFIQFGTKL